MTKESILDPVELPQDGTVASLIRTKSEVEIAKGLLEMIKDKERWGGANATELGYRFRPDVRESVAGHVVDMAAFADYLFAIAPLKSLTDEIKAQTKLIIYLHDLDEWVDGDISINAQAQMTEKEKLQRVKNKREALVTLINHKIEDADTRNRMLQIYDAFENRHENDYPNAQWVEPLAMAYAGLLDRLQGTAFKLRNSTIVTPEDVADALDRIGKEMGLIYGLARSETNLSRFHGEMSHLEEELWRVLSHEIFGKKIYRASGVWDPRPARIKRDGDLEDLASGAKNLHELQGRIDTVLFGDDVNIEFENTATGEVFIRPGGRHRVKARIPTGYFGANDISERFEPDMAVAEAVLRENFASRKSAIDIASVAAINPPVERSRAGQLSMQMYMDFDMKSVSISAEEGVVLVDMDVINTSQFLTYRFSTRDLAPVFRLAAEPTEKMLIGANLVNVAKDVVGCDEAEASKFIHRSPDGTPVALKLPISRYMQQAPRESSYSKMVDMNSVLTATNLDREELDEYLQKDGWVEHPSKLFLSKLQRQILKRPFTIIGETIPVCFPNDIVGRISQNILVESDGRSGWIGRHGGSRYVDAGFGNTLEGYSPKGGVRGMPIRTEILTSTAGIESLGQQYIIVYLYPGKPNK